MLQEWFPSFNILGYLAKPLRTFPYKGSQTATCAKNMDFSATLTGYIRVFAISFCSPRFTSLERMKSNFPSLALIRRYLRRFSHGMAINIVSAKKKR